MGIKGRKVGGSGQTSIKAKHLIRLPTDRCNRYIADQKAKRNIWELFPIFVEVLVGSESDAFVHQAVFTKKLIALVANFTVIWQSSGIRALFATLATTLRHLH